MKITTIEQLKERIGKYVVLSDFDEECKGGGMRNGIVDKNRTIYTICTRWKRRIMA